MKRPFHHRLAILAAAGLSVLFSPLVLEAGQPVKVFILAGQSNMQGAGQIEANPERYEGKGSLSYLAENDPKYKHLRKGSGGWDERDDVSIWYLGRKGELAPGFGSRSSTIGPELGFGGKDQSNDRRLMIRNAQAAPAKSGEFKGNVMCVETAGFFRPAEESPSNQGYHWNGNAETYYLIGEAMGEAMKELTNVAEPRPVRPAPVHTFRSADGSKSFKGWLQAYDAASELVTVRLENGKIMTFELKHLHPDDREFVTSDGEDAG